MKTLPNHSKAIIAAAVLTAFFASGCERRNPPADGAAGTTSSTPAPDTSSSTSPSAPMTNSAPPATTPAPSAPNSDASATDTKTAGTAIDDTIITTKVKTALLADSDIKGLGVDVDTAKGVVTLSGAVTNQTQIDRAAKVAGDVQGVGSVVNNLTIKK